MSSSPLLVVLLVLCLAVAAPLASALHSAGFTWSSAPSIISTTATTEYHPLTGPYATIYYWSIYVAYKPKGTTAVQYLTYNWGQGTPWDGPFTVPNANSSGGAAMIDYYRQPVAIWSDAATSTLRFAIQDYSSGAWGDYSTSTYSAHQSPPNLYTPFSAEMFIFHRQATSTEWGNCSYDGYTVFDDFPHGRYTRAYSHGTTAVNNLDPYTYIFYLGANSSTTTDGYIHYMYWNFHTSFWSGDITTRFRVDTDTTLSAYAWENSTDTYIFVFYKYQSTIYYVAMNSFYFQFFPSSGNVGFSTGLLSTSGPSAVVYQDPFYDTQIVSMFFSKWSSASNNYLIYNAIAIPDSWP